MITTRALVLLTACTPIFAITAAKADTATDLVLQRQGITQGPTNPNPASSGTIGRSVAADFTGDGVTDVFTLIDGKPVFFASPETWDTYYTVPSLTGINDIDAHTLVDAQVTPLAIVNSTGLQTITFDPVRNEFNSPTTVSASSYWQNAKFVRAGYLDGPSDTQLDYVGVASDLRTIVVLRDGTLTHFALPSGYVVYDVMLLRYRGYTSYEIGILDSYGVEVIDYGGSRVKRFQRDGAAGSDAFCSFHRGQEPRECIAWTTWSHDNPTTKKVLRELHWESDINAQLTESVAFTDILNLGDLPTRVARADVLIDGNCNSDLIVYRIGNYQPVQLRNLLPDTGSSSYQHTFDSAHFVIFSDDLLGYVTGASTMPAPLAADLNGDSWPDLFLPIENGTQRAFEVWNGRHGGSYAVNAYLLWASMAASPGGDDHTNTLSLTLGLGSAPTTTPPVNALEVIVWSYDPDFSEIVYTPEKHYYFQTSGDAAPTNNVIPIPIQLDTADDRCFPRLYWFEIRWAVWTAKTQTLRAAGPTRVVLLAAHNSPMCSLAEADYYEKTCLHPESGASDDPYCAETGNTDCFNHTPSVQNVYAPGTITRHRMAPSGGLPPAPAIPEHKYLNP